MTTTTLPSTHRRSGAFGHEASDDRDLVARAQAGDQRALDLLLRRHQAKVHATCRRITGNEADALDATQDALIAIVRGLPRFDGRSRFSTWAARVATNACLDELRRRRRRPVLGLPEVDGRPVDLVDRRAVAVADEVTGQALVDELVAELPEAYRAALVLRELHRFEYAEIAVVLGVPVGTVRSRIARGRAHLADHLVGDPAGRPAPLTSCPVVLAS